MALTHDEEQKVRAEVIAYQVFPWNPADSGSWGTALYTAVPEEGRGVIESDGSAFQIDPDLIARVFPVHGLGCPPDGYYECKDFGCDGQGAHYLVVRWGMNGPMHWAIQRDDHEEVHAGLEAIARARGEQYLGRTYYGPYGDKTQHRFVMDRAIVRGHWREFSGVSEVVAA